MIHPHQLKDETMGTLSDEALKDVAGGATTNWSTTYRTRGNGCRGCPTFTNDRRGNDESKI